MAESSTAKEALAPKPFWIRGHHLRDYYMLLQEEFLQRKDRPNIKPADWMREYVSDKVDRQIEQITTYRRMPAEYVADTYGTGYAAQQSYKRQLSEVYVRFFGLPDEVPIILTELPDEMCDVAAIGEHCGHYGEKDAEYVNAFLKQYPKVRIETVQWSKHTTRKVHTTVGEMKKYLQTTYRESG